AIDDADRAPLDRLYRDFLAAHDRVYGHATAAPARIVNLRSVHRVAVAQPAAAPALAAVPGAPRGCRRGLIDPASGVETAAVARRRTVPRRSGDRRAARHDDDRAARLAGLGRPGRAPRARAGSVIIALISRKSAA